MIALIPAAIAAIILLAVAVVPLWRNRHTLRNHRGWLISGAVGVVLLATTAVAGTVLIINRDNGPSTPRAVIVDQLAVTDPNADFIANTAHQLEAAGYRVDYVGPASVTVDFYRKLPGMGYKLVILRSHSAEQVRKDAATGELTVLGDTTLITGEPYSLKTHLPEQYRSDLGVGSIPQLPDHDPWFTVYPSFIRSDTSGHFDGTLVVLMGCAGLKTDALAMAFVDKGASEFISWDQSVTAEHTDLATSSLLRHLFADQLPGKEAVAKTMDEVGADPTFGARLVAYP